jgi:hypothetical protein
VSSKEGLECDDDGDEECDANTVKARLKQTLMESLDNDANKILNKNETFIFKHILLNDQLELFTNPRREIAVLNKTEQTRILFMLEQRVIFIKKTEARIHARIDRNQIPKLNAYIMQIYDHFESRLDRAFNGVNSVTSRVSDYIKNVTQMAPSESAQRTLSGLLGVLQSEKVTFDYFLKMLENLQSLLSEAKGLVKQLREEKYIVDFFVTLLPVEFRTYEKFSDKRNWLSVRVVSPLHREINTIKIYEYIKEQYRLFEKDYQSVLDKLFRDYLKRYGQFFDAESFVICLAKSIKKFS